MGLVWRPLCRRAPELSAGTLKARPVPRVVRCSSAGLHHCFSIGLHRAPALPREGKYRTSLALLPAPGSQGRRGGEGADPSHRRPGALGDLGSRCHPVAKGKGDLLPVFPHGDCRNPPAGAWRQISVLCWKALEKPTSVSLRMVFQRLNEEHSKEPGVRSRRGAVCALPGDPRSSH